MTVCHSLSPPNVTSLLQRRVASALAGSEAGEEEEEEEEEELRGAVALVEGVEEDNR